MSYLQILFLFLLVKILSLSASTVICSKFPTPRYRIRSVEADGDYFNNQIQIFSRASNRRNIFAFSSFFSKFASSLNLSVRPGSIEKQTIQDSKARNSLKELFKEIEGTNKGAESDKESRSKVIEIMKELEVYNPTPYPGSSSFASGTWDIVWTTEDEIHGFRKGLLGQKCTSVYQITNNEDLVLENRIDYTDNTYLKIISKLKPQTEGEGEGKRVYFSWIDAKLQYGWLKIPFPNFVQNAWYENIYVDKDIRLVRDIRGNYLLIKRR